MPSSEKSRPWVAGLLLSTPAALLLGLFAAAPFLLLLRLSVSGEDGGRRFYQPNTWTTESYHECVADPYFRDVAAFTVGFALGVTALVMLLALPLALFVHALGPRARAAALAAVILPKLASMLVILYGLQSMLSASGVVNGVLQGLGLAAEPVVLSQNLTGAVIGEVYLLLPYAVLVLILSLGRIDPELGPAARGLGASPWQVFRRVTLPLMFPGIVLAGELILLWSLGAFVGPLLLGSPAQATLAVEVQRQAIENSHWPRAAASAVFLLGLGLAMLALSRLLLRATRRVG